MSNNEKLLKEFIRSIINGVEEGLSDDYEVKEYIELELAVVKIKEGGGGLKIFVADAKGKYSKEEVTKIKFRINKVKEDIMPNGIGWNVNKWD